MRVNSVINILYIISKIPLPYVNIESNGNHFSVGDKKQRPVSNYNTESNAHDLAAAESQTRYRDGHGRDSLAEADCAAGMSALVSVQMLFAVGVMDGRPSSFRCRCRLSVSWFKFTVSWFG